MGEIAEMMLDGTLDSVTGEYLGDPCGYPRSVTDGTYWPDKDKLKRRSRQSVNALCSRIGVTDRKSQQDLVSAFLQCIGLARLPKMQAQIEMVFLHHKSDFKVFLREIEKEIIKDIETDDKR
ncbi:hypothetical protein [uncultured Duncaniella sp.]|uniref:hypothetical protein n=1 Tax=uncultured Duncaniella sp. TaxID=2768039 RepID=UPI0025A9A6B8|nr:hypothetical protein [uncultured Duncaniella sp.]